MASLAAMVREAVEEHADRPCTLRKQGDQLVEETYREVGAQIEAAACGLLAAGVQAGENVVLLSEDLPEWVVADNAILAVGAVSVPLYPSLPSEQVAPLIQRVRARVVICEDAGQLAKLDAAREQLPSIERVYVFKPDKVPEGHPLARPWTALLEEGQTQPEAFCAQVAARTAALTEDDVATIIFTSGTTGVPKGAMLTHGNILSNVAAAQARVHLQESERLVTFLPLSHVFQRLVIFLGLHVGGSSLYNESLRHLLPNLRLVRPTVLIVVPRFLELMRDRVLDGIRDKEGLSGIIARWAMEVADQVSRAYVEGRKLDGWLRLQQRLAEQRVFSAIREQLGLDRLRFMVAGGAALPPELGRWFYGIGLHVVQGYGLTETSPAVAVQDPDSRIRFDTIGPPVDGAEVKLAEDGELLVRGPMVMKGYHEMPTETAEAIDPEGWFHTGDLAAWTDDGQLQITDRKKNIMVLANGKNVAPAPIEAKLTESPLISQVMLIGDNQNVVSALIVPQFDLLKKELEQRGETVENHEALVQSKTAEKLIRAEISRLSTSLAMFEGVRKFRLLPREFTVDSGELTPTQKVRRKEVLAHYADLVREMAE